MYTALLHTHSTLRYVVLVLLLLSIFKALTAGSRVYTEGDKKLNLFTLISSHIQLLVGLVLYFVSPMVDFAQMSNKFIRYWNVEHIAIMIIALVLITVGYSKSKKAKDSHAKHKAIALFYSLGLLLIMVGIFMIKDRNPW
ncbi:cytochrome B [Pseudopedobacter beijingensis]|uniref:Cytochrome B n=1 Tax=Pseudopedobacter beijingensis TaxID=1207056 RepID=A0ABW4IB26_9SPHI